jgi:hypothetical protein
MKSHPQPSGVSRVNQSGPNVGRRSLHALIAVLLGLLALPAAALAVPALLPAASANGVPLVAGDVLAATGSGQVKNFSSTGTLQDTLDNTSGATYTTGMCFNASKDLFVTNFDSDTISEFDSGGNLLNATFATAPTTAESCAVDIHNNMFVGGPGAAAIYEFNSTGTLINTFSVTGGSGTGGTDWVDLEIDNCTILYTGEGSEILSYNVCTSTQNPDFATGLPGPCYELRLRPNGDVIVACASEAESLDSSGNVLQTYPVTGSVQLFAMNLDPDDTTFWTGDIQTGEVSRVDIATGNVLTQFNSSPSSQLAGLSIVGGIVPNLPSVVLTPPTGTANIGTMHTVTATIGNPGGSISGQTVHFTVTGANSASGSGTTNTSGQATFTYTGTNVGTDTITGTFSTATGTASMVWTTNGRGCKPVVKHVFPIGNPKMEIVRVLITGTCLGGATHVTFGSVAATSFTVGYGGNITASPPQQLAGKVDVTVTTPSGTSALNPPSDQYTYYLPTVTHVILNHGSVTGGNTVLIQGSMFSGTPAPTVSFGTGNFSSSVVVANDGTIHALVPPHSSGTVNVQVTAFTGSSLPTSTDQYTYK